MTKLQQPPRQLVVISLYTYAYKVSTRATCATGTMIRDCPFCVAIESSAYHTQRVHQFCYPGHALTQKFASSWRIYDLLFMRISLHACNTGRLLRIHDRKTISSQLRRKKGDSVLERDDRVIVPFLLVPKHLELRICSRVHSCYSFSCACVCGLVLD